MIKYWWYWVLILAGGLLGGVYRIIYLKGAKGAELSRRKSVLCKTGGITLIIVGISCVIYFRFIGFSSNESSILFALLIGLPPMILGPIGLYMSRVYKANSELQDKVSELENRGQPRN